MTMSIPDIIRHADGEVTGKIRLQKMVYLLSRVGYDINFSFEYYHYGPYSKELAEKVEDEIDARTVSTDLKRRQSDGVPYIVYSTPGRPHTEFEDEKLRDCLRTMNACSSTVLELAATIDWLAEVEQYKNWRAELQVRKGAKTGGDRTERALQLLEELGLAPAA